MNQMSKYPNTQITPIIHTQITGKTKKIPWTNSRILITKNKRMTTLNSGNEEKGSNQFFTFPGKWKFRQSIIGLIS